MDVFYNKTNIPTKQQIEKNHKGEKKKGFGINTWFMMPCVCVRANTGVKWDFPFQFTELF